MVLWSLFKEILYPHSVEPSSYFRLIEQVSYQLEKENVRYIGQGEVVKKTT
jgi:hypothetical protein